MVREIPVIWLQASACTGCTVSLLNSASPTIKNILIDQIVPGTHINLRFHPTIMASAGQQAIEVLQDTVNAERCNYLLVVEGAIPVAADAAYGVIGERNGNPVTLEDRLVELARNALAILAVGTCAAFGGVSAAVPNLTGCKPVKEVLDAKNITKPLINIPGCPPHPDWVVGTVVTILFNGLPKVADLDNDLRPLAFYGKLVHDNCPLRTYFDAGKFARKPGEEGCLYELGCKGPITYADCPIRHWNNGTNWCIGAGAPCNGCTQSEFPDLVSPFYQSFYEVFYDRLAAITKAGVLVHDTELCAGCGVCGLMCSLYHEGVQGPALARVETTRDPFTGTITFNACQQCLAPSCYLACPKRDRALCIDEETGCVYVNEAECDACGEGVAHCTQVCPLDPPRIRLKWKPYLLTDQEEKEVVFKCDLCRGRKAGPICVEFCPSEALTYVPRSER